MANPTTPTWTTPPSAVFYWPEQPTAASPNHVDEFLESNQHIVGPYAIGNGGQTYYGVEVATNASQAVTNASLENIFMHNCYGYGIKIGQGAIADYLNFSNIVIARGDNANPDYYTRQGFYLSQCQDSTFSYLDIDAGYGTRLDHAMYLSDRCYRLTFSGLRLKNINGGWAAHLYNGYVYAGEPTWVSTDLTFNHCVFDTRGVVAAGGDGCPLIISGKYDNIRFTDCTFYTDDTTAEANVCIRLSDSTNIVIDGFDAYGGSALILNEGGVTAEIKNGVYHHATKPFFYGDNSTGITLTNVTRG